MKIVAVTDPETALALRLAGIETVVMEKQEQVYGMLQKIAANNDIGLVLVTEGLVQKAGTRFQELVDKVSLPLFIKIPDIHGTLKKRKSSVEKMAAILRR